MAVRCQTEPASLGWTRMSGVSSPLPPLESMRRPAPWHLAHTCRTASWARVQVCVAFLLGVCVVVLLEFTELVKTPRHVCTAPSSDSRMGTGADYRTVGDQRSRQIHSHERRRQDAACTHSTGLEPRRHDPTPKQGCGARARASRSGSAVGRRAARPKTCTQPSAAARRSPRPRRSYVYSATHIIGAAHGQLQYANAPPSTIHN